MLARRVVRRARGRRRGRFPEPVHWASPIAVLRPPHCWTSACWLGRWRGSCCEPSTEPLGPEGRDGPGYSGALGGADEANLQTVDWDTVERPADLEQGSGAARCGNSLDENKPSRTRCSSEDSRGTQPFIQPIAERIITNIFAFDGSEASFSPALPTSRECSWAPQGAPKRFHNLSPREFEVVVDAA